MAEAWRYPFTAVRGVSSDTTLRPLLPVTLTNSGKNYRTEGLLDTGADVNVLPYQVGLELGANWEQARTGIRLSGNLTEVEARGLLLTVVIADFQPARLAFAWTRSERVPLILGQVNFFTEFDVCFFQSRNYFEISRKRLKE